MTRDELAARLFVVMIQERDAAHWRSQSNKTDLGRGRDGARQAFDLADAFEAERKRRLAEPEGE